MDYSALLADLMAEQERVSLDKRHVYRRDKAWKPGVTTVCKVMDAPFLDAWKVRVQVEGTARAAHANPPLFGEEVESYVSRLVALGKEQYEHQRLADQAADLGTQVHSLIEHAVKTMLRLPCDPPVCGDDAHFVFAGWAGWAKGEDFSPLASEIRVYNRKEDYCGTADCLATLRGKLVLIDWKPQETIYPERRLQLSAYAESLVSMGWPLPERYVVAMPRNGGPIKAVLVDSDHATDYQAFLSCLSLFRWLKAIEKAKGKAA